MTEEKKLPEIDRDILDNATDEDIEAFTTQYSKGNPEAIKAYEVFKEYARRGDSSARRILDKMADLSEKYNSAFFKAVSEDEPEAVARAKQIVEKFGKGQLTPGETAFILDYARPAAKDIDKFLSALLGATGRINTFLDELTPAKARELLPRHDLTPQEREALIMTEEEDEALFSEDEEKIAAAEETARQRKKSFLCELTIGELIEITNKGAPPEEEKPRVLANSVYTYKLHKDPITKAVFGEKGLDGEKHSIIAREPEPLPLWNTGRGKNQKKVTIYAQLIPENDDELQKKGVTVKRNLSKRAREVYGAVISHYYAGNKIISSGMIGKIIYNARDGSGLTEEQRQYIEDGVSELINTGLTIDTRKIKKDEAGNEDDNYVSLLKAYNIDIVRKGHIIDGVLTSGYINGVYCKTVLKVNEPPALYELQEALEKKNIISVPIELMRIPGRTDEDIILIRAYLLRRVDAMKHNKRLDRRIIYKNILDEIETESTEGEKERGKKSEPTEPGKKSEPVDEKKKKEREDQNRRTRRKRILKKVERVLDYWKTVKTPDGEYIRGYIKLGKNGKPIKNNTPLYEIEILL